MALGQPTRRQGNDIGPRTKANMKNLQNLKTPAEALTEIRDLLAAIVREATELTHLRRTEHRPARDHERRPFPVRHGRGPERHPRTGLSPPRPRLAAR